jgi:hypothetical protein
VTSVGVTKPGQKSVTYTDPRRFNMPVLIDTGSTLSYFREDLVAQIGQVFGAVIDSNNVYVVDCRWRKMAGTVDFGFNRGRMVISVSYKDFLYEQYPGHCMLGAQPADVGSTNYVLGDTFIRGAYCKFMRPWQGGRGERTDFGIVVFDQQSDIVWMNQYYNCGDGVVSVGQTANDTGNIIGAC